MKRLEENYSVEGTANGRRSHSNGSFHVLPEKVPGQNPGQGKQLLLFKFIIIDYYKHYNNSEFDAPEINDVALKV